ncbi:hypothetical protein BO70DRAFT_409846 [Aspergillus heteromorphus CBS 117.55]|uniref:Uncharacterized protein n=1 Tax=Aspergillus heteromorphus CBS 117.55 TaxID=1448321 RepID=A0A317UJK7_9EURO|nr:hypothetical protein BO70DRAFT_409846 [Aspergillus heteromorphus CBS 117.55]
MSTTWRENYSFPRIFKGRRGRTGPRKGRQEEKRTLPRTRRRLRVQLRCRGESTSRCRNINRLPFRHTAHEAPFKRNFPMP